MAVYALSASFLAYQAPSYQKNGAHLLLYNRIIHLRETNFPFRVPLENYGGIIGNEHADDAAKNAHENGVMEAITLSRSDACSSKN